MKRIIYLVIFKFMKVSWHVVAWSNIVYCKENTSITQMLLFASIYWTFHISAY